MFPQKDYTSSILTGQNNGITGVPSAVPPHPICSKTVVPFLLRGDPPQFSFISGRPVGVEHSTSAPLAYGYIDGVTGSGICERVL